MNNPNPAIANLSAERLRKLLAEREADRVRLAVTDAKLAALCRKWSDENGYKVTLRPDQMLRAIEAGAGS